MAEPEQCRLNQDLKGQSDLGLHCLQFYQQLFFFGTNLMVIPITANLSPDKSEHLKIILR